MSTHDHAQSSAGGGDESAEFHRLLEEAEQHAGRVHGGGGGGGAEAARSAAAGTRADPVSEICKFWPVLRPVLQIVLSLPFVPRKVKDVVRQAIDLFNRICHAS